MWKPGCEQAAVAWSRVWPDADDLALDGSAYSEYLPTAEGQALMPVLVALARWGKE